MSKDAIHSVAAAIEQNKDHAIGGIEIGMVGWEGDTDENYFEIRSDYYGRRTFVHVQMFHGRDISRHPTPEQAQGYQLLCSLNTLALHRIPPRGTIVHISIPNGHGGAAGAGGAVIVAALEKSPEIQYSGTKAKMDFGDDVDLVIKARSVTITNYDNAQISLTPEGGVQAFDKDGAGFQINSNQFLCTGQAIVIACHGGTGTIGTVISMDNDQILISETTGTRWELSGGSTVLSTNIYTCNYNFGFLGPTSSISMTDNFAQTGAPGSGGGAPTKSNTTWLAP